MLGIIVLVEDHLVAKTISRRLPRLSVQNLAVLLLRCDFFHFDEIPSFIGSKAFPQNDAVVDCWNCVFLFVGLNLFSSNVGNALMTEVSVSFYLTT